VIVETLWLIIGAIAVLNVWATWRVLRDEDATGLQRVGQTAVVWLVPLVGAALTLYLKRREPERGSGHYREVPDAGDDFGYSAKAERHAVETLSHGSGESDTPSHE
jgi:hypothetical protein